MPSPPVKEKKKKKVKSNKKKKVSPKKRIKVREGKSLEEYLKKISEKNSIPLEDVKEKYKEFQELRYTENQNDDKISKSSFSALFFYDKKYQNKFKLVRKLVGMLLEAYNRDSKGFISFTDYLMGKRLLESDSVNDNIRFIFMLVDLIRNGKIKKTEIKIFLKTLEKAGYLKDLNLEDCADKLINDFEFDKNDYCLENGFLQTILTDRNYTSFVTSCRSFEDLKE